MRAVVRSLVLLSTLGLVACQHMAAHPLAPERSASALTARSLEADELRSFMEAVRGEPLVQWPPRQWDLTMLTLAAFYFHPDLDVARAHAEAGRAAIQSAGARPNPVLAVMPEFSSNSGNEVSPWDIATNLDWPIETAGKRTYRIRQATAAASAAHYAVFAEAWRIRRQLESTLVALVAARQRVDSLEREVAAETRLVRLLDERIDVGTAAEADLAPVRFASLQSTADLAAARAQLPDLSAQLAAALGVGTQALTHLEIAPLEAADANPLLHLALGEARRRALFVRADILQGLASYAAAEAALQLELARQYPDVHLGPGYHFDQGQNKWGLGLFVELPVLNRNEGPIAEATAARDEAAAAFVAIQARAIAEVEQGCARRAGAIAQSGRLRVVAADREANLRRVRSAVRLGAADRVAELGAEVEALRATRAAADAEAALQQALGELEAAIQGPLVTSRAVEQPGAGASAGGAS